MESEYKKNIIFQLSMIELIGIIGVVFMVVLASFITLYLNNQFYLKLTNSTTLVDANTSVLLINTQQAMMTPFNILIRSIPYFTITIGIAALIMAMFVETHPIFIPASLIMWIVSTYLSMHFADIIWDFLNRPEIAILANNYPATVAFVKNLPIIVAVFGFLLLFILYAKPFSNSLR